MKYAFEMALAWMKRGYKIRRASWDEYFRYAFLDDEGIKIAVESDDFDDIDGMFDSAMILADDWEVVE